MKKDPHKNVDESVFAIMTWKADTGDQRRPQTGQSEPDDQAPVVVNNNGNFGVPWCSPKKGLTCSSGIWSTQPRCCGLLSCIIF